MSYLGKVLQTICLKKMIPLQYFIIFISPLVFWEVSGTLFHYMHLNLQEGKRKVSEKTLFYMLHCGKPLYNNLLWANWSEQISNVVILGNSFVSYEERSVPAQYSHHALLSPHTLTIKSFFVVYSGCPQGSCRKKPCISTEYPL